MKRAFVGLGWTLVALWVGALAGCTPLALSPAKMKYLSSAATGCPLEEIQAQPREDPTDGSVLYWRTACRGRKFHCAYAMKYFGCTNEPEATPANPNTLQMALPPSALRKEASPAEPATPPAPAVTR